MKFGRIQISRQSGGVAAIAALVLITLAIFIRFRPSLEDPGTRSRTRVAMDAETGRVFKRFRIKEGDAAPWRNPETKRRTLYPAEKCFWSDDGQFRPDPTYVLLEESLGRPGPTHCPECGRIVVPHNPLPPLAGQQSDRPGQR